VVKVGSLGYNECMIEHIIPHTLSMTELTENAKKAIAEYTTKYAQYEPQFSWEGDSKISLKFSTKGISIQGIVLLSPKELKLELDVPFLLRMFKNKAIEIIDKEAQKWLSPLNK